MLWSISSLSFSKKLTLISTGTRIRCETCSAVNIETCEATKGESTCGNPLMRGMCMTLKYTRVNDDISGELEGGGRGDKYA